MSDILECLGLIHRKTDANLTQRYITWLGFNGFREAFSHIFKIAEDEKSVDLKETLHNHEKYKGANYMSKYLQEILLLLVIKQEVSHKEKQDIKISHLFT